MKILVLYADVSSHRSCLYDLGEELLGSSTEPIWQAKIDWTGQSDVGVFQVKTTHGAYLEEQLLVEERQKAIAYMLNTLWRGSTGILTQLSDIDIIGHGVVHEAQEYSQVTLVTPDVKAAIEKLAALAPNHNSPIIEGIEMLEQILPQVPQVVVFVPMKLSEQTNEASPIEEDLATIDSVMHVLDVHKDWAIAQECWKFKKEIEQSK
jgi:acetate kinase